MGIMSATATDWNGVLSDVRLAGMVILAILVIAYIIQAILSASLANQKGYSALGGLLLGLIVPVVALIYEAGRPLSPEKEDERQRLHARELARVLRRDVYAEEQPAIRRNV